MDIWNIFQNVWQTLCPTQNNIVFLVLNISFVLWFVLLLSSPHLLHNWETIEFFFIKFSRPAKCLNFNAVYFFQYLRFRFFVGFVNSQLLEFNKTKTKNYIIKHTRKQRPCVKLAPFWIQNISLVCIGQRKNVQFMCNHISKLWYVIVVI